MGVKYALMLNDMRSSNIENLHCVKVSSNRDELVEFHKNELATEGWRDENWWKEFKKGSVLEWCNPARDLLPEADNYFGGIYEIDDRYSDEEIMNWHLYKR